MSEVIDVQQALEWYITAGVDVICGNVPYPYGEQQVTKLPVSSVAQKEESRKATTTLAQATVMACQNARQGCAQAENLEELRLLVENFDGCSLKLTANKTVF